MKSKVEKILPSQNKILVNNANDANLVSYDKLIVATGAKAFIPEILNVTNFDNVFVVRKIEDGINIKERMQLSNHVTIIGSGYIGIEMLEAFVKNGKKVTIIEKGSSILPIFDSEISALIMSRLNDCNDGLFEFLTGESIVEFTGDTSVKYVKTLSGKVIATDMVVIASGVVPNVDLARDCGIEIGETGAIKVNKLMQTSIENIYACGDCAEKRHLVSGKKVWIPLGSTANKEGRCAAMNVAGIFNQFEGVLGSAVTRCLNTTISMTGLTEKQAVSVGFSPVSVRIDKTDKVGYMPGVGEIHLKIVADKVTGMLLGGQAIGSIGADKSINALTSALLAHLTVEEFSNNDFTYAPPYSPTIHPLLNAMMALRVKIEKS